jgi:flagellar hook assembly protein FlgD
MTWNGYDEAGNRLLPGKYKIEVELTENGGEKIKASTQTVGKIEAVRFKKDGTVLVINGTEVSLGAINDVRESSY